MSELRDKIRAQGRFARMRLGQDAPEMIDVPSMHEVRVAQVPLTEAEAQIGLIRAANLEVPDNAAGINARNREAAVCDVWNSCRMPDDITEKVWGTPEEMVEELQSSDIDYLFDSLVALNDYASPSLGNLEESDIEDLKKGFGAIDWKELSGRQASVLALCISVLLPELLAARYSSSGYTPSLMPLIEREESTQNASQSFESQPAKSVESQSIS